MNSAASQPQASGWLVENGPKELELLFRAIVFNPSAPILIADNDRHYREASVGASKLLGLPREKIIGKSLDDFAEPSFKPVHFGTLARLSRRRRAGRNASAGGSGRRSAGSRVLWQRETCCRSAMFWCYVTRSQRLARLWSRRRAAFPLGCRTMRCSCWTRTDRLSPGMRERSVFTATRAVRSSATTCRSSIPTKMRSASWRRS